MEKLNKPDNIVAEKIITRLAEKQLLSEEKKTKWLKNLSSEAVSPEDWSFLADSHIKKRSENLNDNE